MTKATQVIQSIVKSPFLWGLLGAAGFYALIFGGPLDYQVVRLYFTYHPVEYLETAMFAVGLAALVLKMFDIGMQRAGLNDSPLSSVGPSLQPIEACDTLLARLERLSGRRQGEYYIRRLRAALEHVRHRGSADQLDDELKYQADLDVARLHQSYGLFRVIVWAIPILGFLGTVIGITMMLTGAAQIANGADQSSMFKIFEGLGLKFNTTALALTLSMALMFIHFFVERAENSLLEQVDVRVQQELAVRFPPTASTLGDHSSAAVFRMAEATRQMTETLLRRQAELWQASVEAAARQWSEMIGDAGEQVKAAMSSATGELCRKAEVLEQAISAAGEVARLEDSLNSNLNALAGAKHFEQTVLSLAAAVNMLSARLAETPQTASPIKLESSSRRSVHAA
ncbi:MAG: MotA/TolQ/ExbB proton channel family protein [Thermoguttaceae bacterium]